MKDSIFTCTGISYSEETILLYDLAAVEGRQSLFKFTNETNMIEMALLDPSEGYEALQDPLLISNKFAGNTFKGCNSIGKGAIFHLSNGG